MKRYQTRPVEVSAFQFDPAGEHKDKLPEGIQGVPSPGADNWNYEGCRFFVTVQRGTRMYQDEIRPLDWIVITDDGNWRVCAREAFERGFRSVQASDQLLLPPSAR